MKPLTIMLATVAAIGAGVFALVALAADNKIDSAASPRDSQVDRVERGRYLVHGVGLCNDCHTPRDEHGGLVLDKELQGAPIPFQPAVPMPWMPAAPRIAGLPAGFTADDMVHFLMTGERPNGRPGPLPPMPPYRMNREDAEAVVAYVRTLPTGQP